MIMRQPQFFFHPSNRLTVKQKARANVPKRIALTENSRRYYYYCVRRRFVENLCFCLCLCWCAGLCSSGQSEAFFWRGRLRVSSLAPGFFDNSTSSGRRLISPVRSAAKT